MKICIIIMGTTNYDPDLDPLIINDIPTKGIIINKREHRINYVENNSRLRFGVLTISLFLFIYVCFMFGTWSDDQRPQIIVNVPPIDENLPGPKGKIDIIYNFV